MPKVVHAACPHDCPDACGILITVDELSGRATRLQGDPSHPVTRGFLCAKVAKYLDRVYSPDRLLYPMKRVQPKGRDHFGPAAFQRISWDEAFDTIIAKIRAVAAESGPEAILPYSYGGTLGLLNNASMDHRFFHLLGASQLDRTICATAGGDALLTVLGKKLGTEPEQFRHSRYIIAWGSNIHGNNVHLWPFIEEARRNGAKLIVIDPYRTRTARLADWHLAINPGTDVALALGLMRVIIDENLYDADYVARYTLGFDELKQRVREDAYSPENVAALTGIPAADIIRLAREYAGTHPAVIRVNYGIQRCQNGGMAMRAVAMLPCLTGSWKEVGGGLQLSLSGSFPLNDKSLTRPDLMLKSPLGRPARVINMSELGKALNHVSDPPVRMVFVYNSNPAAVAPNHNDVVRGFLRPDLFTVVHDQFFTDTTDYADIILPATTFFEHKELQKSYGHYYLQISEQAIAPLGESKCNVDLFRELALRMGMDQVDPCFRQSVDEMIDGALGSDHPWLAGIDRARLESDKHVRLNFFGNGSSRNAKPETRNDAPFLPFAEGNFPTASGKAELYSAGLAAKGLDPVARFIAPTESRHNREVAEQFPLELLARKADNHLNTTFCNLPGHAKMEEAGLLELAPADASPRNIKDGDPVRVFNGRGEVRLTARVDGAVRPGVVAAKLTWARLAPDKLSINALTAENLTEIGAGATFYSCLVQVERI